MQHNILLLRAKASFVRCYFLEELSIASIKDLFPFFFVQVKVVYSPQLLIGS